MESSPIAIFEQPGPGNTSRAIEAAGRRLACGGIEHVVVASSTGETALVCVGALGSQGGRIVCVTHHVGFRAGDEFELDPTRAAALREAGIPIVTATHALSGVSRSISSTFGGTTPVEVVAHTLRLFGQGMKVCVEIAVMAADAGAIPTDRDVLAIGEWARRRHGRRPPRRPHEPLLRPADPRDPREAPRLVARTAPGSPNRACSPSQARPSTIRPRRSPMKEMIAYCGLSCSACPAFVATKKGDREALTKLAEDWSREFKTTLKADDCLCDGCTSTTGRQVGYCRECKVRACATEQDVVNCAHCDDYACEKLTAFHANAPQAKANLERIRGTL